MSLGDFPGRSGVVGANGVFPVRPGTPQGRAASAQASTSPPEARLTAAPLLPLQRQGSWGLGFEGKLCPKSRRGLTDISHHHSTCGLAPPRPDAPSACRAGKLHASTRSIPK